MTCFRCISNSESDRVAHEDVKDPRKRTFLLVRLASLAILVVTTTICFWYALSQKNGQEATNTQGSSNELPKLLTQPSDVIGLPCKDLRSPYRESVYFVEGVYPYVMSTCFCDADVVTAVDEDIPEHVWESLSDLITEGVVYTNEMGPIFCLGYYLSRGAQVEQTQGDTRSLVQSSLDLLDS